MPNTPASYMCAKCLKRYSTDGMCEDCKISLIAVDTIPCPDCGSELPADAGFCTHCGVSLKKMCTNCGTILGAEDIFCQNCGTKNEEGSKPLPKSKNKNDIQINLTGKDVLGLVYEPVSLREFKSKFSILSTGPDTEEYNLAIEKGLEIAEEPPAIVRLGTYPRLWAIDRPWIFKRWAVMAVDSLLWFLMFTMILELLVGDKPGGGILRSISAEEGLRSIFILSWFFGSYFIYTALPEYIMGTTIGGLVFGSRVVNEYGNKLTFWQIIKRQIKRIFAPILLIFWQSRDNEIVNY